MTTMFRAAPSFLLVGLLVLFFLPMMALGHGTGGSFEQKVGDYTVDVGYEPAAPQAGERLLLDFKLNSAADDTPIDFSDVWVRIEHDKDTLLATGVARTYLGPSTLLYVLPESIDSATISVRYEKGDKTLAESSFPLKILPADGSENMPDSKIIFGLAGLFLGALGVHLIMRRSPQAV